jgi:hypothetical protein
VKGDLILLPKKAISINDHETENFTRFFSPASSFQCFGANYRRNSDR